MKEIMKVVTKVFLLWPPAMILLAFLTCACGFLVFECIPIQVRQIQYFLGVYENAFDAVPILAHIFAIWVCLALAYGFGFSWIKVIQMMKSLLKFA